MHRIFKFKLLAFFMLAALFASPFMVFAEGDGSGGGQNQPLALLTSTPADGAQNAARDTQIKLSFNKNVVNMSVAANNRKCFSITQGQNNVAFDVVMADDQVQPEGKRDIILVPRSPLLPGTRYTVNISSGLLAKNGSTMLQAVTITFTTAGAAPQEQPAQSVESEKTGNTVQTATPAARETTQSITEVQDPAPNTVEPQPDVYSNNSSLTQPVEVADKDASQAPSESAVKENRQANGMPVKGWTYAGIIALLGAGGLVFYSSRRK